MPDTSRSRSSKAEEAPPAIVGMMQEQTRQANVLTTLQHDMGEIRVSIARIEQREAENEELQRIVRGENGDRSLVSRMTILEQRQVAMGENWKRIEETLDAIRNAADQREAERSRLTQGIWVMVISALVTVLCNAGAVIFNMVRHP